MTDAVMLIDPSNHELLEQTDELARTGGRLGPVVLAFCRGRWASGHKQFHINELQLHCRSNVRAAPASPDRILRMLRRDGRVKYVVVNRAHSFYELTGVA